MKIIVLITAFLCLVPKNDEAVAWREDLKLQWNDFKGKPDNSKSAVAITASGITFGYAINETENRVTDFEVTATAHFYPDKSWYKPERVNDTILDHERLHFDITEWHVRKLRLRIGQLKPNNQVRGQLDKLYQEAVRELQATQKLYDAETDHSRKLEQQLLWQKKVAMELKKLEKFRE